MNKPQTPKACLFAAIVLLANPAQLLNAEPLELTAELLEEFTTFDARQGVAVDELHFYAVNNTRITKHDKDGEPLLQWDGGPEDGSGLLIHLDSAMVHEGKLYAAHSNYPFWPMTSSVEIWDTQTLQHSASHSFGVQIGSFTWLDRHDGYWWGAFGNYDRVQDGMTQPYGGTANTTLVKMNDEFAILEQWLFPPELHARFTPMSNSGGSWGPDGLLYITGHDHPEIYVVRPPQLGSTVEWLATVHVPGLEGQGIAWDRSESGRILWGIHKATRKVFRYSIPELGDAVPEAAPQPLLGPGAFSISRD